MYCSIHWITPSLFLPQLKLLSNTLACLWSCLCFQPFHSVGYVFSLIICDLLFLCCKPMSLTRPIRSLEMNKLTVVALFSCCVLAWCGCADKIFFLFSEKKSGQYCYNRETTQLLWVSGSYDILSSYFKFHIQNRKNKITLLTIFVHTVCSMYVLYFVLWSWENKIWLNRIGNPSLLIF